MIYEIEPLGGSFYEVTDAAGEKRLISVTSVDEIEAVAAHAFSPPQTTYPTEPTVDDYRRAIQQHIDATAIQRGYDSIHTAVGYRDDPNPAYAAEAQALFVWRSAVWTYAFAELAKVESGARPQPSVADFITELPAMVWPPAD